AGSPAARDDGARMTHAFAGRCGPTCDEANHRLLHMVLDPARTSLFGIAADLAYHDHGVGLRIVVEHLHHVDMLQAVHRIAANAHARRLPKTLLHQLANGFVGESTGARHHADAALLVNVAGHDADLDFVRRNYARTVVPDETRLLALHLLARANHVAHGYALGCK